MRHTFPDPQPVGVSVLDKALARRAELEAEAADLDTFLRVYARLCGEQEPQRSLAAPEAEEQDEPEPEPVVEEPAVEAEATPEPPPVEAPAPELPKPSTKERIAALHAEQPNLTAGAAADLLGINYHTLVYHSTSLQIRWRKSNHVRNRQPKPEATPSEEPEQSQEPEQKPSAPEEDEPEEASPSYVSLPPIVDDAPRPKGGRKLFRLRQGRGEGKYLHMSGEGLVPGKSYSWIGTEAQLAAARRTFPGASDLVEEPAQ